MWRNLAAGKGGIIMQVESPKLRLLANDGDDVEFYQLCCRTRLFQVPI